ncbi:type VII secretion-associated serine protease mycosin [Plantactinospora siamensis]|uniref:Type VII secretion-associated serine protease mycosin n=1 Tax=Plantactinospora siamensis TaxID=555372 RepID=A0ABV6NQ25_9ACTN
MAVVDSGTDAGHPQLSGKVLTGFDALRNAPGGDVDCVSHGTAVASIIAAQREEGIGFQGLAPGARILPVRVTERELDQSDNASGADVPAATFARAIRRAVDGGARVINLSVTLYVPDPEVEAAVRYARAHDVVMVAAAGNRHHDDGRPDPTPYPAAFDGVIGVGAIEETGARVGESQIGPYVDLVAPGGQVVAATRLAGHNLYTGTSFATPMVSATAALIRSAEPGLSADEVAKRIIGTTDPARGDASLGYGSGVLDMYRAVTERLSTGRPAALPPLPELRHDPAAAARAHRWATIRQVALWVLLGTVVVVGGVAALGVLLPRGRRRRWRPARPAGPPPPRPEIDEPAEKFFQVPASNRPAG